MSNQSLLYLASLKAGLASCQRRYSVRLAKGALLLGVTEEHWELIAFTPSDSSIHFITIVGEVSILPAEYLKVLSV